MTDLRDRAEELIKELKSAVEPAPKHSIAKVVGIILGLLALFGIVALAWQFHKVPSFRTEDSWPELRSEQPEE